MLTRVYKPSEQNASTYANCSVATQWHSFQDFAQWFEHEPNRLVPGIELDKDLISIGNTTYAPDLCCLIPRKLNCALKAGSYSGKFGSGVKRVGSGRYEARVKRDGAYQYLGLFNNAHLARNRWREAHARYLRELCTQYAASGLLCAELCCALNGHAEATLAAMENNG